MDNEVNETLSHSDVSMEFAEGLASWEDADNYEVPEPEAGEIENEGSTSEAQGESEEVVEDAPAESGIESFEDLAESVGEESQESESEDSSEASEDSSEAEGSEASGDVESKSLEELIESGEFTVKAKVNGEEVDVSLADLKQNYAGQVAWDKKFSELDGERKAFQGEVDEVNAYINNFSQKMQQDPMDAMAYFAEFGGMAPHVFKQHIMKGLMPEFQRYAAMTPEQIDMEFNQQDAAYNKEQLESLQSSLTQREANTELLSKETELREAQMIDSQTWDDASAHIKAHLEDKSQYSPELVRDFIIAERAENLIGSVDEKLMENAILYDTVQSVIKNNPDFTDEDVLSLLKGSQEEYVEKPKQQEVKQQIAKKIEKSKPVKSAPKKDAQFDAIKDREGNEITDWDDLEDFVI